MRLAAGARVVGTVVLVVVGAVIEEAFHAAHAGPIVNHVLGGAEALLVADPVRRQSPRVGALLTLALAAVLTPVGVQAQILLAAQRLQLAWLELRLGLHPDYPVGNGPRGEGRSQQSLLGGAAAGTCPRAAPGPRADRADGPGQRHPCRGVDLRGLQPGGLAVLGQTVESLVFVLSSRGARSRLEAGSRDHGRPLCVLIGVPDSSDLIQGQHVYLLEEGFSRVGLPTLLSPAVTGCLQQGLGPTATLSSGLHRVLEVWSLQQA